MKHNDIYLILFKILFVPLFSAEVENPTEVSPVSKSKRPTSTRDLDDESGDDVRRYMRKCDQKYAFDKAGGWALPFVLII